MNGKQVKKLLEQHGWRLDRVKGSHHVFKKEGCSNIVLPIHGKNDLALGTERDILKDANLLYLWKNSKGRKR